MHKDSQASFIDPDHIWTVCDTNEQTLCVPHFFLSTFSPDLIVFSLCWEVNRYYFLHVDFGRLFSVWVLICFCIPPILAMLAPFLAWISLQLGTMSTLWLRILMCVASLDWTNSRSSRCTFLVSPEPTYVSSVLLRVCLLRWLFRFLSVSSGMVRLLPIFKNPDQEHHLFFALCG